jgi:plastocyanin
MSAPMGRVMRIAVAVGAAVMLSAAAATLADEPTTFEVTVRLDSFKFDPASIILEVGDSVQWINADSRRHLMSSVPGTGAGDQLEIFCPDFFPEKSCEHTFNTPGRYPYFCFIHRQMVGEVIVLER